MNSGIDKQLKDLQREKHQLEQLLSDEKNWYEYQNLRAAHPDLTERELIYKAGLPEPLASTLVDNRLFQARLKILDSIDFLTNLVSNSQTSSALELPVTPDTTLEEPLSNLNEDPQHIPQDLQESSDNNIPSDHEGVGANSHMEQEVAAAPSLLPDSNVENEAEIANNEDNEAVSNNLNVSDRETLDLTAAPNAPLHIKAEPKLPDVKSEIDINALNHFKAEPTDAGSILPSTSQDAAQIDDLTQISGIDHDIAMNLHKQGIRSYAQIASWTQAELSVVSALLDIGTRPRQQNWIEQAAQICAASETDLLQPESPEPAPSLYSDEEMQELDTAPAGDAIAVEDSSDTDTAFSMETTSLENRDIFSENKHKPAPPLLTKDEEGPLHQDVGQEPETEHSEIATSPHSAATIDREDDTNAEQETAAGEIEASQTLTYFTSVPEEPISEIGAEHSLSLTETADNEIATSPHNESTIDREDDTNAEQETAAGEIEASQTLTYFTSVPEEPISEIGAEHSLSLTETADNDDKPDDLTHIEQITAEDLKVLQDLGLMSFKALAGISAHDTQRLKSMLHNPERLNKEQWIEQAAMLADGQLTYFAQQQLCEFPTINANFPVQDPWTAKFQSQSHTMLESNQRRDEAATLTNDPSLPSPLNDVETLNIEKELAAVSDNEDIDKDHDALALSEHLLAEISHEELESESEHEPSIVSTQEPDPVSDVADAHLSEEEENLAHIEQRQTELNDRLDRLQQRISTISVPNLPPSPSTFSRSSDAASLKESTSDILVPFASPNARPASYKMKEPPALERQEPILDTTQADNFDFNKPTADTHNETANIPDTSKEYFDNLDLDEDEAEVQILNSPEEHATSSSPHIQNKEVGTKRHDDRLLGGRPWSSGDLARRLRNIGAKEEVKPSPVSRFAFYAEEASVEIIRRGAHSSTNDNVLETQSTMAVAHKKLEEPEENKMSTLSAGRFLSALTGRNKK